MTFRPPLFLCLTFIVMLAAPMFADEPKPHVVMLIAEREYETDTTLPRFARDHLQNDYQVSFVYADPQDPNTLVGIEKVAVADVLLISVRRRALPQAQLDIIRRYVADGKPVVGIRTANHAFLLRNAPSPQDHDQWLTWDHDIFGGSYSNHYGGDLTTTITFKPSDAISKTLLTGIDTSKPSLTAGSLYVVSPLSDKAQPFLYGTVEGKESEPIAWTFKRQDGGKSFYTSLGHKNDFGGNVLPALLENAIQWCLE